MISLVVFCAVGLIVAGLYCLFIASGRISEHEEKEEEK